MNYDEFVNEAQHRLERPGRGPTVRAIRAVLTALGERLHPDEAKDLASNLPMEIDRFLLEAESGQRFSYKDLVSRISEIDKSDPADAAYLAQVVIGFISEVVPEGELRDVKNSLPDEFEDLFEKTQLARA
jgi:uncharacterized protein (DUF2267 family)